MPPHRPPYARRTFIQPHRFDQITFVAEGHTYTLGDASLNSVSSLLGRLKRPFDGLEVATRVAPKRQKTVEALLQEWEDKKVLGAQRGSRVHDYIQASIRGESPLHTDDPFLTSNPRYPEMDAFDRFWERHSDVLNVLAVEWVIGDPLLGLAGTLDMLVYSHKTRAVHVLDWKTNESFSSDNRWRQLLNPFADLQDCDLNFYSLQTSLYRLILERNQAVSGAPIGIPYIIHLGRDGEPHAYRALDLRHRLERWLLTEVAKGGERP